MIGAVIKAADKWQMRAYQSYNAFFIAHLPCAERVTVQHCCICIAQKSEGI